MKVKYKMIADKLSQDIMTGKYQEMDKLPTEEVLIEEYQVSRTTIRNALNVLIQNGFVLPIQGSGFFVRPIRHQGYINLEVYKGLSEGTPYKKLETFLLDFQLIKADEKLAKEMKCEIETEIYYLQRLRSIDDEKRIIEYSYFNKDLIPYLNEDIARHSIYHFIQHDLKLEIGFVDRIIEARTLTDNEAKYLELPKGSPALVTTNYAMLKNGRIFDYSIDVYHYQKSKFLKLSNFN